MRRSTHRMLLTRTPSIATSSGDNFLDVNPKGSQSILNITQENDPFDLNQPFELNSEEGEQVFPKPGFCIKSKTKKGEKVFINMCHSEDVPKPDEKLMSPNDAAEDESVRVPLGLGLPHKEKDKSGKDCICIDVLINTEFLNKLLIDEDARSFVLHLCIQGIADKYGIFVRDDCCLKLTKPYHGTVQKYFVKNTDQQDNPFAALKGKSLSSTSKIRLMESSSDQDKIASDFLNVQSVRPKNSMSKSKCPVQPEEKTEAEKTTAEKTEAVMNDVYRAFMHSPYLSMIPKKKVEYGFFQMPASRNYPRQYVLEINLQYSFIGSHKHLKIYLSTNRIVVVEKLREFALDISLPNPVILEQCRGNLYRGKILLVLPIDQHSE